MSCSFPSLPRSECSIPSAGPSELQPGERPYSLDLRPGRQAKVEFSQCLCALAYLCSFTRTGRTSLGYLQSPRSFEAILQVSRPPSTSLTRFSGTFPRPIHLRYGSVNPGSVQGFVCLWQFTILLFVCVFFFLSFLFLRQDLTVEA